MISLALSLAFSLFAAWFVLSPLCSLKEIDSKGTDSSSNKDSNESR